MSFYGHSATQGSVHGTSTLLESLWALGSYDST